MDHCGGILLRSGESVIWTLFLPHNQDVQNIFMHAV